MRAPRPTVMPRQGAGKVILARTLNTFAEGIEANAAPRPPKQNDAPKQDGEEVSSAGAWIAKTETITVDITDPDDDTTVVGTVTIERAVSVSVDGVLHDIIWPGT